MTTLMGKQCPTVESIKIHDGGVAMLTYVCGHTRWLASAEKDKFVRLRAIPLCHVEGCDGAPAKKPAEEPPRSTLRTAADTALRLVEGGIGPRYQCMVSPDKGVGVVIVAGVGPERTRGLHDAMVAFWNRIQPGQAIYTNGNDTAAELKHARALLADLREQLQSARDAYLADEKRVRDERDEARRERDKAKIDAFDATWAAAKARIDVDHERFLRRALGISSQPVAYEQHYKIVAAPPAPRRFLGWVQGLGFGWGVVPGSKSTS